MNPRNARFAVWLVFGIALLFNVIFWKEKMGINTAIFDLAVLIIIFILYPTAKNSAAVRWLVVGHLICVAMIVIHNSALSKIAYSTTLLLVVAFSQYVHRSVLFATGSILQNIVFAVPNFIDQFPAHTHAKPSSFRFSRRLRLALIPIILVLVFVVIYSSANSIFSKIVSSFITTVGDFFANFSDFISIPRLGFFVLGLFIAIVILLKSRANYFSKKESKLSDDLVRRRTSVYQSGGFAEFITSIMGRAGKGMLALKNANTIGLISIILLNLLLLVVNGIDISYIWMGIDVSTTNLYEMIHNGTELLIISILLAILVLLLVFKGNLNFYRGSKQLKIAAYCWIIQNIILVVSVLLRDIYYIRETGLAYKRVGVLFYLALVCVGLLSVLIKISRRKSIYFLLRVNTWAVMILLVFSTTINWDEYIASYNFNHKNEIIMPVGFMVTLSGKAIPLLDQNRAALIEHKVKLKSLDQWNYNCEDCYLKVLDEQIRQYKLEHGTNKYTWLSWNSADA
ncbi:MAG: DUF4173 domain-containing protein, partial [Chitinophagaceae bacterium]|nr:DUF4173 domain-containing protein [Chitinophagaceae bacterium]